MPSDRELKKALATTFRAILGAARAQTHEERLTYLYLGLAMAITGLQRIDPDIQLPPIAKDLVWGLWQLNNPGANLDAEYERIDGDSEWLWLIKASEEMMQ